LGSGSSSGSSGSGDEGFRAASSFFFFFFFFFFGSSAAFASSSWRCRFAIASSLSHRAPRSALSALPSSSSNAWRTALSYLLKGCHSCGSENIADGSQVFSLDE
jgi:hypothetical protein